MGKVLYSLGVAALGMIVVFVGLLILIGFIKILSVLVSSKKKEPVKEVPVQPEAPAVVEEDDSEIPGDVIAAITAAIASVWDSPNGFTVRKIRRINNAPAWNRAGRNDQVNSRF